MFLQDMDQENLKILPLIYSPDLSRKPAAGDLKTTSRANARNVSFHISTRLNLEP